VKAQVYNCKQRALLRPGVLRALCYAALIMKRTVAFRTPVALKNEMKDAVAFMQSNVDTQYKAEDFGALCLTLGLKELKRKHNRGKSFPRSRKPLPTGPAPKAEE
jgi:hypothetical protein